MRTSCYLFAVAPISVILAVVSIGCSSTPSSQRAKPLAFTMNSGAEITRYKVATVLPFELADTNRASPSVGARLAEDIRDRLKYDYGALFSQVREGPPLGTKDELVVTGTITKYAAGSRTARFILIGLGPASLEGELVVKDGSNQQVLLRAPFNKLWAWGGSMGAAKGIEEMSTEVGAAAAAAIAHARGWQAKK